MKVCLRSALYPAFLQGGIEALYTPLMISRLGYCEYNCTLCGQVCPTGAIPELPVERKKLEVIGKAVFDKNHCIPWADGKTCLVCQELCPVPDKAILIDTADVKAPNGAVVKLGRPQVIAERCIGCGVCENACPVAYQPAIVVYATQPRS